MSIEFNTIRFRSLSVRSSWTAISEELEYSFLTSNSIFYAIGTPFRLCRGKSCNCVRQSPLKTADYRARAMIENNLVCVTTGQAALQDPGMGFIGGNDAITNHFPMP
jgi:hypothetical protein